MDGIGPFTTLFIEVGTAAAALWITMLRVRPRRTVLLRHYLFLGLLEPVVAYGALDLGLQRTGAPDSTASAVTSRWSGPWTVTAGSSWLSTAAPR
ncbi:hypothetical protein [Streptomyces sp. G7(2002)]|uniref:hypothetical protein n=1 Tax=Streptomyces sp. G7(2002) TaxID=2971798 RepID=UPI00406BEF3F